MAHHFFTSLSQYESFNQAIMQGHFKRAQHQLRQATHPSLKRWLEFVTKQPLSAAEINQLPPAYAQCWQGWLAYHTGNLNGANQHFTRAFMATNPTEQPALAVDTSLGLGRLYTRSGYFATARDWLLYAITLARTNGRLYDTVRSFGALGDLFLRTHYYQEALFCLSAAHQLLPPGAGERPRQLNYLATVLMRLGTQNDQSTAEDLLMQSFYLAKDKQDTTSMLHSLARLQFLYLDMQKSADNAQTLLEMTAALSATDAAANPSQQIPLGFLAMGRSFAAALAHQHSSAAQQAAQACEAFKYFPAEYHWAQSLVFHLQNEAPPCTEPQIPTLTLQEAPVSQSVINQRWKNLTLNNLGAAAFQPQAGLQPLLSHRKVFFL